MTEPRPVSARRHNEVLAAAQARVDRLEVRLADVVRPILDRAGTTAARRFERYATSHLTAAADGVSSSSTMVCVRPRPEEAEAIAAPGGDPPERLHVTLVYLGQTDGDLQDVADALAPVAASLAPLAGVVGGYGAFEPPGVGILLPDVRGLVELRVAVCEALLEAGVDYGRQHGFEAHITVTGGDAPEEDDYPSSACGKPLHFDSLIVTRGDEDVYALPLVGVPAVTAAGDEQPSPQWTAPFPDEILDVDALVAGLLARTEPVRKAMVEQTMTPALEEAGLSWDATNPLAAAMLAESASQVRGIAATTQLNVMRIVSASYRSGLTVPQTATAIREGMRSASKSRATTIARTELARAANGGSLAATRLVARATGASYRKTWRTAPGAPHPRHEDYEGLDGQQVGLEEPFEVGGDELQFPGDPGGDPGETINCRCTMTYDSPEGEGESDAEDTPDLGDASSLGFG